MSYTALLNGRVVLPDRILERAGVLIRGGQIAEVGYFSPPDSARIIDAEGGLILAGFIDAHLHGGGGADFMDGTPECFEKIARTHCLHGTTCIAVTTLSCPYEEMEALFDVYRAVAGQSDSAEFAGIHLEGPYLSGEMCGAQNPAYVRRPVREETERLLRDAGDLIVRCSCAPELEGMDSFAASMREAGILLSIGHSNATCQQVEHACHNGFRHITHLYSATSGIRKIDQRVCGGIIQAAYLFDELSFELIGDGHHVPPEVLRMAIKCKGKDDVFLVSDAMRAAGTDVTESYLGACRPENRVIVEDGVAKLPDRSSFAGSVATGEQMFRNAYQTVGLPLTVITKLMSRNPARHLNLSHRKGILEAGKDADVVVFDSQLHLTHVFARGRQIK